MTERTYLYGRNPLNEALRAYARTGVQTIEKLFVTKAAIEDPAIMSLVQKTKIAYTVATNQEIESIIGRDAVHQGVMALLDDRVLYTSLSEVLSEQKERPLFVLLDELQDPHNVGAIIRSAVAFGATAILMPEHNQTQLTGTVIKVATGMNFSIPIVRIGNINTTLLMLKEKGFWTYGLTGDGDTSLPKATFDTATVIVIGSEGSGIAKKTLEHCDFKLSIPMSDRAESLNASNAAAVTLYEWHKQQG